MVSEVDEADWFDDCGSNVGQHVSGFLGSEFELFAVELEEGCLEVVEKAVTEGIEVWLLGLLFGKCGYSLEETLKGSAEKLSPRSIEFLFHAVKAVCPVEVNEICGPNCVLVIVICDGKHSTHVSKAIGIGFDFEKAVCCG